MLAENSSKLSLCMEQRKQRVKKPFEQEGNTAPNSQKSLKEGKFKWQDQTWWPFVALRV